MFFPGEIIVDNFAGGGGASSGMEIGLGRHVDIAINHDPDAIAMHKMNHPEAKHYCESVWDVDPVEACDGRPVGLGWFSPDCKHFSKAKGGKPVDKNVRGLAWVVLRWGMNVPMRMFMLENVEEFLTWGPLKENAKGEMKPDPLRKGETFDGFAKALTTGIKPSHPAWREMCLALGIEHDLKAKLKLFKGLGYEFEWRILSACDYGTPTTRKRFFLVARKDGMPIVWPNATHGDPKSYLVQSGVLKPWKTAAEDVIDWNVPVRSIFNRKRPLAPKTMERIAKGVKKFIMDCDDPFIVPEEAQIPFITECANASNQRNMAANEPLRTICAQVKGGHFALVSAFIAKHYTGVVGSSIEEPLHTITATDHNSLVVGSMVKFRGSNVGHPTDEPIHTVSAGGNHLGEVRAFLLKYYGTSSAVSVEEPIHTITTKERFGLVTVRGVDYQIVDIGLRMLEPYELFKGQGFDEDYKISHDIDGNKLSKKVQVARCGNAVCPPVAAALVRANCGDDYFERLAA